MMGLLIQEFKTLVRTPASISILVIPLVLLVGLGYLLPSGWIVPSSITIGIVAAVLLYFGGSIEEIKRTSFMKSISLTRLSKFTFLSTKILFAMVVSIISVLWVLLFSWVFTETPLAFLATDFSNLLGGSTSLIAQIPFKIQWQQIQWFQMIYAGIVTIVVAVSLSFVFVAFAKSSLSFYLMSFGYLLAMILFGGVVMPGFLISESNSWFKSLYYLVPNFYTNNIMANAFSGGIVPSVVSSLANDVLDPALQGVFDAAQITNDDIMAILNNEDAYTFINIIIKEGGTLTSFKEVTFTLSDGTIVQIGDTSVVDIPSLLTYLSSNDVASIHFKETGLTGAEGDFDASLISINLANLYNGDNWAYAESILGFRVDNLVVHINSIFLQDWFNSGSSAYILNSIIDIIISNQALVQTALDLLVKAGIITQGLADGLEGLIPSLIGMFGNIEWWNWPLPWIEGVLFLGISIRFFKWS